MSNRIAPKLLADFIGTFALVFIGGGAAAVVGEREVVYERNRVSGRRQHQDLDRRSARPSAAT